MKLKTRIIVGFVAVILVPLILFSASLYGFSQTQARHMQESSSQTSDSDEMVYDISLAQSSSSQVRLMAKDMILTATIILVFTALSVGLWIYRSIAVPLVKLRKATRNIKEGNLDFVLEVEGNDEFSQLCQDFEEMRKRLKESTEEKILMDKENKELISNISHDLKTPITAVKGYVEGIMDGVADTPEKMDRYVRTIYNKTNEMDHLINELTFYSKIDTNRIPYTFSKLNVEDYFSDCAEELGLEMETRGIELVYANYVEKGVQVIADGEQIRRVIHNIVSNAIKYMEKPKGIIQLRVKDVGDFIQVEIEDNGKGIAAKDLPYIFDRFYRTDVSRNSSKGGSGIGLSIVKKIMEDHGGKVWATSRLGIGTIMYFVLRKYQEVPVNEQNFDHRR
jgi:signal transduction histidine kinase